MTVKELIKHLQARIKERPSTADYEVAIQVLEQSKIDWKVVINLYPANTMCWSGGDKKFSLEVDLRTRKQIDEWHRELEKLDSSWED